MRIHLDLPHGVTVTVAYLCDGRRLYALYTGGLTWRLPLDYLAYVDIYRLFYHAVTHTPFARCCTHACRLYQLRYLTRLTGYRFRYHTFSPVYLTPRDPTLLHIPVTYSLPIVRTGYGCLTLLLHSCDVLTDSLLPWLVATFPCWASPRYTHIYITPHTVLYGLIITVYATHAPDVAVTLRLAVHRYTDVTRVACHRSFVLPLVAVVDLRLRLTRSGHLHLPHVTHADPRFTVTTGYRTLCRLTFRPRLDTAVRR